MYYVFEKPCAALETRLGICCGMKEALDDSMLQVHASTTLFNGVYV